MNNIDSFLGFTDTIKEPRKTKVENTLDKLIQSKGVIYNIRTYLLNNLLEGREVKRVDDIITYNKHTLERNKLKTEYRLLDTVKGCYYNMNKTEYDFCIYCINNGYDNIDKINQYVIEEEKQKQLIKDQEEAREKEEAEKEQAFHEEFERVQAMIKEEVKTLSEEQKEIMNSIFLSMLGSEANNNCYTLLVCINNFDNEICKNEIISRLHNDNKASIKTFECITGLKLPKGYKDRIEYLNSITSRDFVGMVEYKERKKADHQEVITEEFYISEGNNTSMRWKKVIAEPYNKHGLNMFIRAVNGRILISEVSTGILITDGKNLSEAKQKLDDFINREGMEKINNLLAQKLAIIEDKAGKNPYKRK